MKWFVAILALLNGLVYYWLGGQPEVSGVTDPRSGQLNRVPTLVLLSELPDNRYGAGVENIFPGDQARSVCWVLGPFDKPSIERLSREMDAAGLSVTARGDVDMETRGYWVYLPAPDTNTEREALISALSANNVDYFIFGNGKLGNGISLGFFRLRENAERKQEALLGVGFSPVMASTISLGDGLWVSMSSETFAALSKSFWRDMGGKTPALMVDAVECGRVGG